MISFQTWALFALTETVLCLTPGPAVLLVLSQGLARGTGASVWSNLGILSGNTVYFALSATGLGALLLASYELFSLIRWAGAAYLLWLGVTTFLGRSGAPAVTAAQAPATSGARMLLHGFVLQISNPKALVFFTALLPQFIDPGAPITGQLLILALTSVAIEFVVLLAYGAAAGRATALAARPRFRVLTNRLAGSMLILAGINVARIQRA